MSNKYVSELTNSFYLTILTFDMMLPSPVITQILFAEAILNNFSELSDTAKWPERLDFIAHIESPQPSPIPLDNMGTTALTSTNIGTSDSVATSVSTNSTPAIIHDIDSASVSPCTDPLVIEVVRGWEESPKRKGSSMQECFFAAFVDSAETSAKSKCGDDFLALKRREFAGDAVVLAAVTRLVQHLIASKRRGVDASRLSSRHVCV